MPRKRVVLVDVHAILRRGLAMLINESEDLEVCGEAHEELSAFEVIGRLLPDVAIVDWSLGNQDTSGLIRELRQSYPKTAVLVLSIYDEIFYAERAIRSGAHGYVMKQEATERIVDAIRRIAGGQVYLTERALASLPVGAAFGGGGGVQLLPARLRELMSSGEMTRVSAVIPVFNSEKTIERLGESLINHLRRSCSLQLILVNDGSVDGSAEACRRLHEAYPEVVDYVELSRNFGEHNAVMAGLNHADGDYCVIMDDDLQNPPEEVSVLIQEIKLGFDVVYARYAKKQHSWLRNAASALHNWTATLALGKPKDLYLCSFKVLSRFVVREVVRYPGPDPYLDAIILRTTRKIGVATVQHEPRGAGRSGYTLGKLFSLWSNMAVSFSIYPMRLIGLFGWGMILVGAAYALRIAWSYLHPEMANPDPIRQYDASNWLLRGVTVMMISMVAEYVGRIHMSINRTPQYIVRGTLHRRGK